MRYTVSYYNKDGEEEESHEDCSLDLAMDSAYIMFDTRPWRGSITITTEEE